MHLEQQHAVVPLDRFRQIIGLLNLDRERWTDAFWLRFAAQVLALRPESPEQSVQSLSVVAGELRARSPWYGALASPIRFAVAAMLIENGESPAAFLGKRAQIGELLAHAGLRPHGIYGVMTALNLLLAADLPGVDEAEVARLKAIHDGVKHNHWWLTGIADLPASAALVRCRGTADEVVKNTEDIYRALLHHGMPAGKRTLNAACLLPLADASSDHAARRFLALHSALSDRSAAYANQYGAIALLSLLFHDPQRVSDRVRAVCKEIDLAAPTMIGDSSFTIAAGLAVLDLQRFDHDLQLFADPAGLRDLQRDETARRMMLAVIVCQTEVEHESFAGAYDVPWN